MLFVRKAGASMGGLISIAASLLFVLLVLVGGNIYRKDCLTSAGTVSRSWTFTWDSPIPFVFRQSETGCVVHVGTRVALSAVGLDTFTSSTPESIAEHEAATSGSGYWPELKGALDQLVNEPRADSLSQHVTALAAAHAKLSSLRPPPAARSAHQRLVAAESALLVSGRQLQRAALRGDRHKETTIFSAAKAETAEFESAITELNRISIG